jgi:group I intron endonuclease
MTCGVYLIWLNGSEKIGYVGKSVNIQVRCNNHLVNLRRGKHENQHLQRAFNKYGSESFGYKILEECDSDEDAFDKEIRWIKKLGMENLYNLSEGGKGFGCKEKNPNYRKYVRYSPGSEFRKGHSLPEDSINKMRIKLIGRHNSVLTEFKKGHIPANTKLDEEKVREIKSLIKERKSLTEISKIYGVTVATISNIKRGKTWSHVKEERLLEIHN